MVRTVIVIAWLLASTVAGADSKPWETGTTAAQRAQAHKLFTRGNEHFFAREYAPAIELFKQALAEFDHPRIQLALARTLVRVGRPAEAHPHLTAALRHGKAALDAEEYADALDLRAAITNQVGVIIIECKTTGSRLTLDGAALDGCTANHEVVVSPGRHQVVASREGYLTFTEEVIVDAGRKTHVEVRLKTLDTAAIKQRRWARWKPWAVAGGGAALVVAGIPFRLLATSNLDDFAAEVARLCGSTGCEPGTPEHVAVEALDTESRGTLQNGIAVSLFVVGGAVIATGLISAILNREHIVIPHSEVVVTPIVSSELVGFGVAGRL